MHLHMKFRKLPRLKAGDSVAVVSPSLSLPYVYPAVALKGMENIQRFFGLKVLVSRHAFDELEHAYRHPELRAQDLNRAFSANSIGAVFATIGGYESIRILPFLRSRSIAKPKIFCGFSDCTTVTSYLFIHGIRSIYGSSVMAGFAQMEHFPKSFQRYWKSMLFSNSKGLRMRRFPRYSEGYGDWGKGNVSGINRRHPSPPWHWLNGHEMEGTVFAANIEVLDFLRGTEYAPTPEMLSGCLLLLETSEEVPGPVQVERYLRSFAACGWLSGIRGMGFGRFRGYNAHMRKEVEERIMEVVQTECGYRDMPVVTDLDFGHTDPQFPVPVGTKVRISANEMQLLESFTE